MRHLAQHKARQERKEISDFLILAPFAIFCSTHKSLLKSLLERVLHLGEGLLQFLEQARAAR